MNSHITFPIDMWSKISTYLTIKDISSLYITCKSLSKIYHRREIWLEKCRYIRKLVWNSNFTIITTNAKHMYRLYHASLHYNIMIYISSGKIKKAINLINISCFDVNVFSNRNFLITWAAYFNQPLVIEELLKRGANINPQKVYLKYNRHSTLCSELPLNCLDNKPEYLETKLLLEENGAKKCICEKIPRPNRPSGYYDIRY